MEETNNENTEVLTQVDEPIEVKLRRTELVLLVLLFVIVITWLIYTNGKIIYDNGIY